MSLRRPNISFNGWGRPPVCRLTGYGCPVNRTAGRRSPLHAAFTLLELLTVIAIMGIIAALVAPTLSNFRKGDAMASGTQQMLMAVNRARQLAISQHTTVYMVFLPTNFWAYATLTTDPPATTTFLNVLPSLPLDERVAATNLLEKQLTGYAYVSLRRVDDQPGQGTATYLSSWHALPESIFIPEWKFNLPAFLPIVRDNSYNTQPVGMDPATGQPFPVRGFFYLPPNSTSFFPFPSENAWFNQTPPGRVTVSLPYIAFNYLGQPTLGWSASGFGPSDPLYLKTSDDIYIPLAHGGVLPAKDPATGAPIIGNPSVSEAPPGNSITAYNLIHIDRFTGHATLEQPQVQ